MRFANGAIEMFEFAGEVLWLRKEKKWMEKCCNRARDESITDVTMTKIPNRN